MLASLAIRDVVLIERLDLSFGPGLTVLTGETGAGKSILLDSLGLACGARAEGGLVRAGQAQCSVAAGFMPPAGHPALAVLEEQGIELEDEALVLRRVVQADGRSRAFLNDQPVAVGLLRRVAALLVEVQGQHDQVGLADPATHAGLLDAFGGLDGKRNAAASAFAAWRGAERALAAAREAIAAAQRDEEFLRHAVEELSALAPEEGEEDELSRERQILQQGERRTEIISGALAEMQPRDRRRNGPGDALRGAARALERLPPPNEEAQPILALLGTAQDAVAEAETLLERLLQEGGPDPRRLEVLEDRLFGLRAAARKHAVAVVQLPALLESLKERLGALDAGTGRVAALEATARQARAAYVEAGEKLSAARREAAKRLETALAKELPPLKLDRARFVVEVAAREESGWGPDGMDRVTFLVSTNPGQPPGRLEKIASGGELSRLMLALKVVLARGSPVPTLVFDEVDAGIGGATAAAVGERLSRVAERLQVLVVTHSPQVAARAAQQLRVAKQVKGERAATLVEPLNRGERREEIARMLAGERVTDAARAAADSLLTGGLL
ncbi:MAG: DNA repair protein RecN [uncultured Acetobacteraceae bacterium]|uniref:DNA repair protein RecN n=1 Tax=uncultured Acetobacteraceae bacterium TaxID=169975 RepID=A0A6J4JJK3_9PROT|nr:MAG: DNA repair protein RecN [uncultured Acetobacteraceae bacterium]